MSAYITNNLNARASAATHSVFAAVMGACAETATAVPSTAEATQEDDRDSDSIQNTVEQIWYLNQDDSWRAEIKKVLVNFRHNALQSAAADIMKLDFYESGLHEETTDSIVGNLRREVKTLVRNTRKTTTEALDDRISELEYEISEKTRLLAESPPQQGISTRRAAVISKWKREHKKLSGFANRLMYIESDMARINEMKADMLKKIREELGPLKQYEAWSDPRFINLERSSVSIAKQKDEAEEDIQSFFDHHAHAASKTDTSKADKHKLSVDPKVEEKQEGSKLIIMMDLFLQSRANEFWAILSDLSRVSHDIDPVSCMHWRPPNVTDQEHDTELSKYRVQQSRVFSQRLQAVLPQPMVAKLFAPHHHGVNKEMYQARQDDGVALWWVLIQLTHPLNRDHRCQLAQDISAFHTKLRTGDPISKLNQLAELVQKANEIELKIQWEISGVPIIRELGKRSTELMLKINSFLDLPSSRDDAGPVLSQLIATAQHAIKAIKSNDSEAFGGNNNRASKATRDRPSKRHPSKRAQQARKPEAGGGKGKCQAQGCSQKVNGWTEKNGWRLCDTHRKKQLDNEEDITLKDGSVFKYYPRSTAPKSAKKGQKRERSEKTRKAPLVDEDVEDDDIESKEESDEESPKPAKRKKKAKSATKRTSFAAQGLRNAHKAIKRARHNNSE